MARHNRQRRPRMIQVVAIKRGTRATRIGTVHVDPNGVEDARRPAPMPLDVAEFLEQQGLVEIEQTVQQPAGSTAGPTTAETGAGKRAQTADAERENHPERFGATGADTRDTTAFPKNPVAEGRSHPRRGLERTRQIEEQNQRRLEAEDNGEGDGEGEGGGEGEGEGGNGGPAGGEMPPGDDTGSTGEQSPPSPPQPPAPPRPRTARQRSAGKGK